MLEIRPGRPPDLQAVAAIQAAAPEASQWLPEEYLDYDFLVALLNGEVVGFLVGRPTAPGERELLNLAVQPELRRKGIGRALLQAWISDSREVIWLEVRSRNEGARQFYQTIGFQEVSIRENYYKSPDDRAIVLKFHSC